MQPRRNAKGKRIFGCLLLGLGIAVCAGAQTITLPAVADASLRKSSANQNRGSEPTLQLTSGDSHVVVRFDQAAIAAAVGSGRLVSASLELFVHSANGNWGAEGRPVEAHRLTEGWTEAGVTWSCAIDSNPANNKVDCATRWDGGSFEEDATDTVLETSADHVWIPFDVTADVAAFLSGTPNQGWLIAKADDDQSGKVDYGSREGVAAERPRLVLLVETAANDTVPPALSIASPNQPILVNEPSPTVVVEYADGGSGVDTATLRVLVDGQDVTAGCTAGAQSASCPTSSLAAGNHTIQATLEDRAGNTAQASFAFKLLLGPGPHLLTLQALGDTYLRKGGDANRNFGAEPILRVRQGGANRALVQFDAQSLAASLSGATLVSASLELHVEKNGRNWGKTGRTVDAHRLTAAWTETGVTWNCANDSNPTNNKADCSPQWGGGSFVATPTASVLHTRDLTGWVRFDVTADVAAFAAGTPSYGWLLKKTEENKSGRVDYDSRQGTAGEAPRLVVVFTTPVSTDTTPPALTSLLPFDGSLVSGASPGIAANYSDADSGIDLASVKVAVDGVDQSAAAQIGDSIVTFVPVAPLAEGLHTATFQVSDRKGNQAQASTRFTIDTQAPELAILEPTQSTLMDSPAEVRVSFSDATSGIEPASLVIGIDGRDLSCTSNAGAAVCSLSALPGGAHTVTVRARDLAGNSADTRFSFEIVPDEQAPSLAITAPSSPLVTGSSVPEIRIQYSDAESGIDTATVRVFLDGNDLASRCQVGPSSATCQPSSLSRGPHTVVARVADLRGNGADASFDFVLVSPVGVAITSPEPDFLTGVASVRVEGTVSPTATSVKVNGVAATLQSGTFVIEILGLHDGANELVAVAQDGAGNVGTASVRVFADTTAPDVGITFPAEGAVVSTPTPTVAVTGLVNDLTIGTVSDTEVTVTVNGVAASVMNRSFAAAGITLQPGDNTLTAEATDRAGNRTSAEVHVTYQAQTGVPTLQTVSGDGQSATIATLLPAPLVVAVSDAAGQPMADAQVVFRVVRGNGTLEGGERARIVRTDSQGQASVHWTLGSRAGVGVDRVRVTAVGVAGELSFAATSLTGTPAQIDVASGDDQRGAIGTELSRPLFAVVTDAGHNPVPGLPVTFRVVDGSGGFVEGSGADTAVAETDASGLASVRLVLGPSRGFDNNLVEATFAGMTTIPATFKASGFLAGDPAQTRISGVVLDNQGAPVPGVTMRLRDAVQTTTTNAEGQFVLTGVPVGQVFLIADATTATRPGNWASLEYELFAISGVDNTLPRPIYILPLDLPNGILVDETHGGKVMLPEVPGFAVDIAPGSVTFPGGSRSGVVSVTAVHADRVPMPPGAGMQPRLIVTIQPVGAHFDPPAKFTLPNVDGLAPGTVTEMFSFDHDIGEFVAIGTGTVSEDGLVVQSDPGFGIVEAGWHCGTPPNGSGSTATLKVKIKDPDPAKTLFLSIGQERELVAQGEPPLDAAYSWTIVDPPIASLTPSGAAVCGGNTPVSLCPNAPECKTKVKGVAEGETKAKANLKCCVSNQASPDAELKIKVLKVEVKSLGFKGDHQITEWATDAAAGTVKDAKIDEPDGTAPVWTRPPAPGTPPTTPPAPAPIKKPVAYTKKTPPRMFAVFTVSPSVATPITDVSIRMKIGTKVIATASNLTISGTAINDSTNNDGDVDDITGTEEIPGSDGVKTLTPTFTWEISFDKGVTWGPAGDSGPHTMYWTDAAPLTPPFTDFGGATYPPLYDLALKKACGYVNGDADISGKITKGIDSDINYDPSQLLPSGNPLIVYDSPSSGGLCADLAYLLRGLMRSVGVDGTVVFKFGGPNTTTWRRYRRGSTGETLITFRVLRAAHDSAELNPHFSYHAVVSKGGMLHDPSYGLVYPALNFDETAFGTTPQQTSTSFPSLEIMSTFVCPH